MRIDSTQMPQVYVSYGEAVDKYTIQMIKMLNAPDEEVEERLKPELDYLHSLVSNLAATLPKGDNKDFQFLKSELVRVNSSLWIIEDKLRLLEEKQDFTEDFVNLARNVYKTNDQRSNLKRKINQLFHSSFEEVKIFTRDLEKVQ